MVQNCSLENQYITIEGTQGIVKWQEPLFSDNSGRYRTSVNVENNKMRQAQVYYVDYSVKDDSGNTARCRFFVHVKGN